MHWGNEGEGGSEHSINGHFFPAEIQVRLPVSEASVAGMKMFLTPSPWTYSSSPLDGMARNYYYLFIYHANYRVWIHYFPIHIPEERKNHLF